jgi:hypothetical protein
MSYILIYGRPGSGKTTLTATLCKLGLKGIFIDVDQKLDKMVNLKPLVEGGAIEVLPIKSKLVDVSLKQRILTPAVALAKQPKGYLEFCDIITGFEQELKDGKSRKDQFLTVDSLTSLLEHLDRMISHIQKKDNFTFDEYNILLTNLEEFFYTMMRLQDLFKHVVVIAHEQSDYERIGESQRLVGVFPAIKGSMRFKVGKFFEEMYHTKLEVSKSGEAKYKVTTVPLDKAEARTSRPIAGEIESDFALIFADEVLKKGGKNAN